MYRTSRFEAAEIVYRSVLDDRPDSYRALLKLGYLARRRSDHSAALLHFGAALAAKPHKARPKVEAATELRKMRRLDEAEAMCRRALQDEPKHAKALVGLGRIAEARGKPRLALKLYEAAVAIDPTRTNLKLDIAAQLRKLSRVDEARRVYDSILAEQPSHRVARARRRRLAQVKKSGLPPLDPAWLDRETFTRAAEWGRNLESLAIPAFGMSLLTLLQDFASGASEEVKRDCILIRRGDKTKLLPLVASWTEFAHILAREANALPRSSLLGYVSQLRTSYSPYPFEIVEAHREFVYHRESAAALIGPSLSKYRQEVRRLQRDGARIEPIGPANIDRVLACNERWFASKRAKGRKTYYRGRTTWTFENLSQLEPLGVRHLAVVLDDDVVGYAVSSHIAPSWAAFIYRRCDREPPGVAPYLLSEMSKLHPDRQWINDGPAVRKPGLAWFKERFTSNASDRQMTLGWIKV